MAEHTPGPWHIFYLEDGRPHQIESEGPAIGTIFVTNPAMHANARLIADAPETAAQRDELLAALEHLLLDFEREWGSEHVDDEYPDVRAAIARAKGQTEGVK